MAAECGPGVGQPSRHASAPDVLGGCCGQHAVVADVRRWSQGHAHEVGTERQEERPLLDQGSPGELGDVDALEAIDGSRDGLDGIVLITQVVVVPELGNCGVDESAALVLARPQRELLGLAIQRLDHQQVGAFGDQIADELTEVLHV